MRFLTIACNPAVDTTYLLGRLTPGAINRVERVLPAPGGKGNNVARVLAALGQAPLATGFMGGRAGEFIEEHLRAAGVLPAFIPIHGESRVCLTIVERESGRTTEIREPGAAIGAADAERLLAHVGELAPAVDVAVISGSLPPGLDADFYGELIAVLKRADVFVALDASGDALRRGVSAGPDLIKPNVDELAELIGAGSHDELIEQAQRNLIGPVLESSAAVLLSMGAAGAALIRRDRCWRADAPEIETANTVGSGDALLAGFLTARASGDPDGEALAQAVAVGAAAALQEAVGSIDLQDVDHLRPLIHISERLRTAAAPAGGGSRSPAPILDRPVAQQRRIQR